MGAATEKRKADVAAARAQSAAQEADKEAQEAEMEAEKATHHAEELEAKQKAKDKEKKHRLRGHAHQAAPTNIPLTVIPNLSLTSLLRYLSSALDKHAQITPQEQQLMQSFFLKRGSSLLSQLAEVDPDATWHSRGVMREEQYEMDRGHPDQLSKEWGSKNLKDDTVVTDFVRDALWADPSQVRLARPDGQQAAVGIFGSDHDIALKFDPDDSAPTTEEPDLGESDEMSDEMEDTQRAYPGAISAMMGIN